MDLTNDFSLDLFGATVDILSDFDKKKQFFEDTIIKLHQFSPLIKSPNVKSPRTGQAFQDINSKNILNSDPPVDLS